MARAAIIGHSGPSGATFIGRYAEGRCSHFMMFPICILLAALVAQISAGGASGSSPPATQSVTFATTTVAIPTTPGALPTSQPAVQITVQTPPAAPAPSLIDAFSNRGFGRYMTGKEQLTVQDVLNPAFWTDNIKDLVMTVLAFVPRFLGTMLFLLVFWLIYRGIRRVAVSSMKNAAVDSSIRD